jgi:STE24 endopeptidase
MMALAGSWISFKLLAWQALPAMLGLPTDISLPAKMVVLGFISSLALFPLGPFSAWRSRCHERGDRYASDLTGKPEDLAWPVS